MSAVHSHDPSVGAAILQIFKWAMTAAIAVVGLGGLSAAGAYAHHYLTYERPLSQITIQVGLDASECPDSVNPIYVHIRNGSGWTVESFQFHIEGRLKGRSTNLYDTTPLLSDLIIAPGIAYGACYPIQWNEASRGKFLEPMEMSWIGRITTATFEG